MKSKPLIAISMGDPAGIGPEIIVKALCDPQVRAVMDPLIIGDNEVLKKACKGITKICPTVVTLGEIPLQPVKRTQIPVLQLPVKMGKITPGKWNINSGISSYHSVILAAELAKQKVVNAIVTAPICKEAWQQAGIHYPGHTELLADVCKSEKFAMMFVGGPFRLILATIHKPLSRVPKLITTALIERMIEIGSNELKTRFGIKKPRIGVAGLNPHAGEKGLFGKEEQIIIEPAIKKMRSKKIKVEGPYPPDTLFATALETRQYDLILCMYHDQGLIPFKMLALHEGVNVTAGLPIIRTSPDHGTAFDLAGKGKANPGSMIAAIKTAAEMVIKSKAK